MIGEVVERVFDRPALTGPVVSAALGRITADASIALSYAMLLAAASLIVSAMYLWYENRERNRLKEHCDGKDG